MKEKYNFEDFKDKIGNQCAVCLSKIDNNWTNYQVRGNYCTSCNNKCNKNTKSVESKESRKNILETFNLDE